MFLVREMRIAYILFSTHQPVNVLQERELNLRGVLRPVITVRDQQHGPRCGETGYFSVIGLVISFFMDGHTAFTGTTAEKMRRYHYTGYCYLDPSVQCR